jgi:hypothetical protein
VSGMNRAGTQRGEGVKENFPAPWQRPR